MCILLSYLLALLLTFSATQLSPWFICILTPSVFLKLVDAQLSVELREGKAMGRLVVRWELGSATVYLIEEIKGTVDC